MDYQEIKTKLSENKEKLVLSLCFVLVFIVGFGAGRYVRTDEPAAKKVQSNYTTNAQKQPVAAEEGAVAGMATGDTGECAVKGNISSKGKKIYHVAEGRYYKTVKPEECFATEADAQAAGYVRSSQ